MERDEKGFLEAANKARELAFSFKDPLVVHHYDADGLSSGAIVIGAFAKIGRVVRHQCIKKLDDVAIDSFIKNNEKEIIFVDLGGGNTRVNELQDILIIDHHQTQGIEKFQINPLLFGIDGGDEISAAGVAYCVFREYPELAIVGAVGDMQMPLKGMNRWILQQGIESGRIRIENDLKLYGRYSRPLPQFLAYSDDPLLPRVAYSEEKAVEYLLQIGVKPTYENGSKRTYANLTDPEKKKLVGSLAIMIGSKDKLMGESYIFPKRPMSECFEASGFSTLLNACGRHSKEEIGLNVCLDEDENAYREAEVLLSEHRRMLREGIVFVSSNMQDLGKFYFVDGRGIVDEGVIGIVCGMKSGKKNDKIIIGVANGERETIKISGRASKKLVENGVNLGLMMSSATKVIGNGAIGGGHRMAAGASIPKDKINEFLIEIGKLIIE